MTQIYVDGVFDLTHAGHFNAIRQARAMCERIVVGVNSDAEVTSLKGTLPIYTQHERGEILRSCKWADEVVVGTPYCVSNQLLDDLHCDYCSHGDDLAVALGGKDCYEEPRRADRLKVFKRTEGISTTHLMDRLLDTPLLGNSNHLGLSNSTVTSETPYLSLPPEQQCITSTKRLAKFIGEQHEPKPHHKIVYVDGSFDIFHVGHVRILQKAKALGDYLIVGVHADATVRQVKGPGFPVIGLMERTLSVLAMRMVDEVIVGAPWVITDYLLKMLRVDVVVRGTRVDCIDDTGSSTYDSIKNHQDPYEVTKRRGIYREVESSSAVTTREIIERIRISRKTLSARVHIKLHQYNEQNLLSRPTLQEL